MTLESTAEDWSRFRGPNGTGISHSKSIPVLWKDEHFRWKTELPGTGYSSPIVVGNRIYVFSCDQESAKRTMLCLHVDDGRELWRFELDSETHHLHKDNSYAASTPVADENGVVFAVADASKLQLVALDNEGKQLWQRDLGPYKSLWGHAASPIIFDDMVILPNDQMHPNVMKRFMPEGMNVNKAERSFLVAVDRRTGETRWMIDRKTVITGYATPCMRKLSSGEPEIVFAATAHGITGVNPETGQINWQVNELLSRTVFCPVIAEDLIIATHGTGLKGDHLVAIRPDLTTEWGEVVYDVTKSIPLVPCGIYRLGMLFLLTDDGVLSCRKAKSGDLVWRKRLRGKYYASPVCVDGRLFCLSRSGDVTVVAAKKSFEKLAEFELGEPCNATPAIADGVMYVRTEKLLMAISKK